MKPAVVKKKARRAVRSVAETTPAGRRLVRKWKSRSTTETGADFVLTEGKNYSVLESRSAPEAKRVGIYIRGGCDLGAMMGVPRLMRDSITGTLALRRDSIQISGSRTDLLLQALDGIDPSAREAVREVSQRLRLPRGYFQPRLFEPTFTVPKDSFGEFDKTVVVLSIGADITRSLYRHRQHGFLVDPGGFWLSNSIDDALANSESISWFAENFRGVGRISSADFRSNLTRLITEVKDRTGAHILVFNVLTPDPLERTHNYGLVKEPDIARRLDFAVALAEISHELDFDVIDVDRILKLEGVEGQVDFAHFMEDHYEPIAEETLRVLRERDLV